MQIGIIGAGKVGTTMGKYIVNHGGKVSGFYSRTTSSAKEAAQFTAVSYFKTLDSLLEVSDTLFITTTDGAIKEIWDCIAKKHVKGKVICHFSGSLSSDVFSNVEEAGALACSIHPIYAFSNKFSAYQNLTKALFTVEGSDQAIEKMQELFQLLPNRCVRILAKDKVKYHAAASIASNQVAGLIYLAVELLKEAGIQEQTAYEMLKTLAEDNLASVFSQGCISALTGPIERGDTETVKRHLDAIENPVWNQAYRSLGAIVCEMAEKKHSDRNNTLVRNLLK